MTTKEPWPKRAPRILPLRGLSLPGSEVSRAGPDSQGLDPPERAD